MKARPLVALIALACAATACVASDTSGEVGAAIREAKQAARLGGVRPPPAPDPGRTGRIGVHLSTNSLGWRRTLGTPDLSGAVVLLIVPGSPAERAGLRRGDVILARGDVADALPVAHRAVSLSPYDLDYYGLLAQVFLGMGRRDDAEATVEAASSIATPEQRDALRRLLQSPE